MTDTLTTTTDSGQEATYRVTTYRRQPEFWDRINKRWERGELSADEFTSCAVCGRKIGARDLYIFIVDGNTILHADDVARYQADHPVGDWIGWTRVGTTCAKQIPAEFRLTVARHAAL